MEEIQSAVEKLIKEAAEQRDAGEAMKYAQAALNAANAGLALKQMRQIVHQKIGS